MNRFDECLQFVLGREGGYSNAPADHGGATNAGVTQKSYDLYRAAHSLPVQPVKFITEQEVMAIYRSMYWTTIKGDTLAEPLDLVMFDSAVQHGPTQAIKFLQRAFGIDTVTGYFGPLTTEKAAACDALTVAQDIIRQRREFYAALGESDATQQMFERGWANRMDKLAAEIA